MLKRLRIQEKAKDGRNREPEPDINVIAAAVVKTATQEPQREKNQAAVTLGRLGGLKGGRVRAARLSPEERRRSAEKAAAARWAKQKTT